MGKQQAARGGGSQGGGQAERTHADIMTPLAPLKLQSAHKRGSGAGWRVMCDMPSHDVSFTWIPHKLRRQ